MPDSDVTIGEVYRLLVQIRDELQEMNGHVRMHERSIAILEHQVEDVSSSNRASSGKWGGAAGGFVGGLVAALMQFFGGQK